jgi:hypothetical protein
MDEETLAILYENHIEVKKLRLSCLIGASILLGKFGAGMTLRPGMFYSWMQVS